MSRSTIIAPVGLRNSCVELEIEMARHGTRQWVYSESELGKHADRFTAVDYE